jgi:D-alanyl-D-alanine carboxypeptidase
MGLLTSLILAAGLLSAQVSLPDTPAARRFSEWLTVFDDADRARVEQYIQKNFPEHPQMTEQTLNMRQQLGGLDLEKVEDSTNTEIRCIVKTRNGAKEFRVVLRVEPQEPHAIAGVGLMPASTPAPPIPPAARMSEADAIAALRAEVDKRVAADQFSGAIIVAREGKPIFEHAYSLADREQKTANVLDTKFRIGSMNKMFTATAIVQLAQARKLNFTDPLVKFLPDYPNHDLATNVTIHQLLTHTGGTGDFFGPEFQAHREELRGLKDYITLFGKRGLAFEPGSKWEYSNYGFLLLGLIVESASGQNYYDYVRDHIYKPAGMTSTDSQPESTPVSGRSTGYTKAGASGSGWRPNTDTLPPRPTSAGGGYSTVVDLLAFAQALISHKLLDANHTDLLTAGKVDSGGGGKYAYGFEDAKDRDGVRWFGHGGGAPGMNGMLRVYRDSGYVIAVLANLDPPAAQDVATFIGDRLPATFSAHVAVLGRKMPTLVIPDPSQSPSTGRSLGNP